MLFGSNPEDFGVEGTDKDPIFDSLNTIAQLPPCPSKAGDCMDDSAIQMAESPAIEEVGKKSLVSGTGE